MKLAELKKIGEELEEILCPEDEDGNPISLTKGNTKAIEKKIKEAAELLEDLDDDEREDVSNELLDSLEVLGCAPEWAMEPEDEEDEEDEDEVDLADMDKDELKAFAKENKISLKGKTRLSEAKLRDYIASEIDSEGETDNEEEKTWDDIKDLDYDELSELAEEKELITEADDYEDNDDGLAEFRKDVAIELGIDVPDDEEEDEEDDNAYADMGIREIKKIAKEKGITVKEMRGLDKDDIIDLILDKENDDDDVEDEEELEEVTYDSVEDELNATTKLDDLQSMVTAYDEFKKIRAKAKKMKGLEGTRELRALMFKTLGVKPKKATRKPNKKVEPRYTKVEAVCDAIREIGEDGFKINDVAVKANELFGTPDADPKNSNVVTSSVCNALVNFEILEKDGNVYTLA